MNSPWAVQHRVSGVNSPWAIQHLVSGVNSPWAVQHLVSGVNSPWAIQHLVSGVNSPWAIQHRVSGVNSPFFYADCLSFFLFLLLLPIFFLSFCSFGLSFVLFRRSIFLPFLSLRPLLSYLFFMSFPSLVYCSFFSAVVRCQTHTHMLHKPASEE